MQVEKLKLMILGADKLNEQLIGNKKVEIWIQGQHLDQVCNHKYIWLTLMDNLKWSGQIKGIPRMGNEKQEMELLNKLYISAGSIQRLSLPYLNPGQPKLPTLSIEHGTQTFFLQTHLNFFFVNLYFIIIAKIAD